MTHDLNAELDAVLTAARKLGGDIDGLLRTIARARAVDGEERQATLSGLEKLVTNAEYDVYSAVADLAVGRRRFEKRFRRSLRT